MNEFQHMVDRAESLGLDVFIDVAFNHSGRDTVFGQGGVDIGAVPPSDIGVQIRHRRPSWATNNADYRAHANGPLEWAVYAPADRLGEHQWYDAGLDWYFGDYSSLGPKPGFGDTSRGGALDERDLFYTDLDPVGGYDYEVANVWDYFARLLPFWLEQTGNKLDGIRADFAQGLPPRAWEYIINKTRQQKWDFVFLAEVLDPDEVRYRANRHFDIVTTVDHYLYRIDDVTMSQLRDSLEGEAGLYGYNAAVLHNGTSHDEQGNGNVWLMVARYAVAAANHGVPMVYMGQPLGIPYKVDFQNSWQNIKGFWDNANPAVFTMYRRINDARAGSAALRSTNRWFLAKQGGGGFNNDIFSVARWLGDEVVLVFVNLRDAVVGPEVFAIPDAVPLDGNPAVRYQAVNLLADDPNAPLWPTPRTAADIKANGVFVGFNFANESQYLQLRKVP
jgi:glycosidase